MYMQKIKAILLYIGNLFFRILAGIIVGHLFFLTVAVIFQYTGENIVSQHADIGQHRGLYDYFDSKYNTDSPIFPIVAWVAYIGNLTCILLGILCGIFQSRLNFLGWLSSRYVKKTAIF